MKKIIAVWMALALLLCGVAALAEPDPAGEAYVGTWGCGRASIVIAPEDAGYKVNVIWGDSASQSVEWNYACLVDPETGSLVDEGMGVKEIVTYAEDGEIAAVEELYTDGIAVFTIDGNGDLIWDDLKENAAEDMAFERAIDFGDADGVVVPLPEIVDLEEGTYPVSFDRDAVEGNEIASAHLYTVDQYDIVDINTLEVGDTIIIDGESVVVTSLEWDGDGWLMINGGGMEDGYDLMSFDEDNGWRVVLDDDFPTYTDHGEATLVIHDDIATVMREAVDALE